MSSRRPSSHVLFLVVVVVLGGFLSLLNLSHLKHHNESRHQHHRGSAAAGSSSSLMSTRHSLMDAASWSLSAAGLSSSSSIQQDQNQKQDSAPTAAAAAVSTAENQKLLQAQAEIERLTKELEEMKRKQQKQPNNNDKACHRTNETSKTATAQQNPPPSLDSFPLVCQSWLNLYPDFATASGSTTTRPLLPSAVSIWNAFLPDILQASKHINDRKYQLHDFTAHLLQMLSDRLIHSVKTTPRHAQQWQQVERILDIIHKRVEYIKKQKDQKQTTSSIPRKLRITIMGGSLLVGTNCRKVVPDLGIQGLLMPRRLCTWSARLETFLNKLFGGDVVQITKIAIGGTNSETGSTILQYELMPDAHPDILINAYATNDMHILTVRDAIKSNQTLRDKVFDMTQDFVRTAMTPPPPPTDKQCQLHAPLLLHMEDYLGNEQREIWSTTELSQGVQVLANYYGFASMSYADVVRDVVYANTKEEWLSPPGWYVDGKFEREIHPGMAMHIASMWVTAFNLLHLATTYCSMHHVVVRGGDPLTTIDYQANVGGMPELKNENIPKGKPQYAPFELPPLLTKDLSLENISDLWQKSASTSTGEPLRACTDEEIESSSAKRCPFAWVSGLSQQQQNRTWIEEIFDAQTVESKGWELDDDHGKLGYVPKGGVDSKLVLDFKSVAQPIRVVTAFYMKSYGDDWAKTRVELSLFQRSGDKEWATIRQEELVGVHEKQTSETYTMAMSIDGGGIDVGSDLRISFEMKDGVKFKLQGLAVCS